MNDHHDSLQDLVKLCLNFRGPLRKYCQYHSSEIGLSTFLDFLRTLHWWVGVFPLGLLHGIQFSILLFFNDILLLLHTTKGLLCLVNALDSFNDKQEMVVNLSKTRFWSSIFPGLRPTRLRSLPGQSYRDLDLLLGVIFLRPIYSMRSMARLYAIVSTLGCQCV